MKETIWEQAHIIGDVEQMPGDRFSHQHRLFNLLTHLSESPITGCNHSTVLTNGEEAFAAMLREMKKQSTIFMWNFTFSEMMSSAPCFRML